jgi:amino acid transporter
MIIDRDGGLPASPFFCRVHPKLNVPLNALYLTLAMITIFGLIFLGSSRQASPCFKLYYISVSVTNPSSAFNAIISSSVVMLDIAYGVPIAVNCLRGRNMLPERSFVLSNTVGWIANLVCPNGLPWMDMLTNLLLDFPRLYLPHNSALPLPPRASCDR